LSPEDTQDRDNKKRKSIKESFLVLRGARKARVRTRSETRDQEATLKKKREGERMQ